MHAYGLMGQEADGGGGGGVRAWQLHRGGGGLNAGLLFAEVLHMYGC